MKITKKAPKTGEEFVVAYVVDGYSDTAIYKYCNECDMFMYKSGDNWKVISDITFGAVRKDAMIIVKD